MLKKRLNKEREEETKGASTSLYESAAEQQNRRLRIDEDQRSLVVPSSQGMKFHLQSWENECSIRIQSLVDNIIDLLIKMQANFDNFEEFKRVSGHMVHDEQELEKYERILCAQMKEEAIDIEKVDKAIFIVEYVLNSK